MLESTRHFRAQLPSRATPTPTRSDSAMKKSIVPARSRRARLALGLSALLLAACVSNEPRPDPAPAPPPAAQPAAAAPAPELPECKPAPAKTTKGKTKASTTRNKQAATPAEPAAPCRMPEKAAAKPAAPAAATGGYDLSKNRPVTDSTQVKAGEGTTVKGINDWEGEISGIPAADSRFTKLKIGMPLQQAIDLAGQPTDQGAYVTGKAFIPFYFGSDRARWEAVYKGQGRLIFATQAGFGTGQYLVWIIHNNKEPGYR